MSPLRSLLFVPAGDEHRMHKALSLPADAVVFDLEDAVAASEKPGARDVVRRWLRAPRHGRLYVRINGVRTPFALDVQLGVVGGGLDGVVLPVAERADDVRTIDWVLTAREPAPGAIEILPIIETARGLDAAREVLSASPRVRQAAFGAGDWCEDTGMTWSSANPGLVAARFAVAVASRASECRPPIDTAFTDVRDQAAFTREAELARDLGYQGKFCIHPDQVAPANATFGPSAVEVAQAREIWDRFAASEAEGVAAIVVNDKFVDYPVARQALAVLERAGEAPVPNAGGAA
jgi:citrate lyase subunit beta/citryl-CoA lyase